MLSALLDKLMLKGLCLVARLAASTIEFPFKLRSRFTWV